MVIILQYYIEQIMSYAFNLYNIMCQLYLIKMGKKDCWSSLIPTTLLTQVHHMDPEER